MIHLADKDAAEEKAVETETTQDSSPKSEEAPTKPQTPKEEVIPQETPQEVPEETSDVDVDSTMTEEQRKAFQEQRLEIKRLKEEVEARGKSESTFDQFRPRPTGAVDINTFTNPVTGEVDWPRYNQAVNTQTQATASQTAQEVYDEQRARDKYPEVFADPDLEEALAGQWLASKLQGKTVSIASLAERFSKKLAGATSKAEKEGAKKALTELTPKEQAALSAQGQSSSGKDQALEDEEDLRLRTRKGDDDALAKLMGSVAYKE